MKFQVNIDIDVPRWVRNVALVLVPVAVVVATTAIVRASVPNVFKDGDTLSALKMNDNFDALDLRVTTVEKAGPVVTASIDALDARIKALEAKQTITVVEMFAVGPATKWYVDCTTNSGTFPQGACARMAWDACLAAGYRGGWFEGDLNGSDPVVACIK